MAAAFQRDQRLPVFEHTRHHVLQGIRHGATLFADGHVVMVWIDRATGRPTALPDQATVVDDEEGATTP